jgi:glycosyltransferase involved in cell wall biosynthesis
LLTILIPAYNEEGRIAPTLSALVAWAESRDVRVIVISDGSDSTPAACRKFAGKFRRGLAVISFPHRLGKGAAIIAGLKASPGGDVLSFDADSSLALPGISRMQKMLGAADIVIASRRSEGSRATGGVPFHRRALSFLFNSYVRLLFGLPYPDTQCGYKLYSARAVRALSRFAFSSAGYEWDVEMLLAAKKLGLRVAECPVEWTYREGGKAGPLDLLRMTAGLLRLRLRYL